MGPVLCQENSYNPGHIGQHLNLFPAPLPVFPALVKAHKAHHLTGVIDTALQQGTDPLRL